MKMTDVMDVLLELLNDPNGDRYEDIAYNEFWNAISVVLENSDNLEVVAHGLVREEEVDFLSPDFEEDIDTIYQFLDISYVSALGDMSGKWYATQMVRKPPEGLRPLLPSRYIGYSVTKLRETPDTAGTETTRIQLYPMAHTVGNSEQLTMAIRYINRIERIDVENDTIDLLNIYSDAAISQAIDMAFEKIVVSDQAG